MEKITVNTILAVLEERVSKKEVLDANQWLSAAQALNTLLGEEQDKLFELQRIVAQLKVDLIEAGDSVAKAKVKVEANINYVEAKKQEAKIERVIEMIRISKIQARLSTEQYKAN